MYFHGPRIDLNAQHCQTGCGAFALFFGSRVAIMSDNCGGIARSLEGPPEKIVVVYVFTISLLHWSVMAENARGVDRKLKSGVVLA